MDMKYVSYFGLLRVQRVFKSVDKKKPANKKKQNKKQAKPNYALLCKYHWKFATKDRF